MLTVELKYSMERASQIYFNTTNLFTIIDAEVIDTKPLRDVGIKDSRIVMKGFGLPSRKTGDGTVFVEGTFVDDPKYGLQFNVNSYTEELVKSEESVMSILSSHFMKGIGDKTAAKIVKALGVDALDILETNPDVYVTQLGFKKQRVDMWRAAYLENGSIAVIIDMANRYHLSVARCHAIYKKFGPNSKTVIENDPYKLCDIKGFGFITVDTLARRMDESVIAKPSRVKAIVKYLFQNKESLGTMYIKREEFIDETLELFNKDLANPVSRGYITVEVDKLYAGLLYEVEGYVCLRYKYQCEQETADAIRDLSIADCLTNYNNIARINELLRQGLESAHIDLSNEQKDAVRTAMRNSFSIITGGAGTGKTTVLRTILEIYKDKEVCLLAPTGRAAKRMEEATGHPAHTIHHQLRLKPIENEEGFEDEEAVKVASDVVIIDETSMLDAYIADILFSNILPGTKVILVGDPQQLPAVGAGNVLNELIVCDKIPVVHLTHNYRQASGSTIADNAQRVISGDHGLCWDSECRLVLKSDEKAAADEAERLYLEAVKTMSIENVILLSPFRTRGEASVNALNRRLQAALNTRYNNQPEHIYVTPDMTLKLGDRVMQTKNCEDCMNGDVGTVIRLDYKKTGLLERLDVEVKFDGIDDPVYYDIVTVKELTLAYATTVHKSQGSEYLKVILVYNRYVPNFSSRNLFYTAITRARRNLTIVGTGKAIHSSIDTLSTEKRVSMLGKMLIEGIA